MTIYSLSSHGVNVPERNSLDTLAEQRERRDARTRARMSRKAYTDAILARIREAMDDRYHPLGELVDRLFEAPIRDHYDYRAFLEMRDGKAIGATILCAVCDASLEAYQEADDEGF
jgi:hypothetical protein